MSLFSKTYSKNHILKFKQDMFIFVLFDKRIYECLEELTTKFNVPGSILSQGRLLCEKYALESWVLGEFLSMYLCV